MNHSPTPWRLEPGAGTKLDAVIDGKGEEVFNFGDTETYYNTAGSAPWREDMGFLLHAVNCHDKLLAACKAALGMAETGDYFVADLRNVLRDAIAEAEGEPNERP